MEKVDRLLTPVTQRESIAGHVAYTDGAFDKCIVEYNNETLSVRFVQAVEDPQMEEVAAEARKEIARVVGSKCLRAGEDRTMTIHAKAKNLGCNMIIKVA